MLFFFQASCSCSSSSTVALTRTGGRLKTPTLGHPLYIYWICSTLNFSYFQVTSLVDISIHSPRGHPKTPLRFAPCRDRQIDKNVWEDSRCGTLFHFKLALMAEESSTTPEAWVLQQWRPVSRIRRCCCSASSCSQPICHQCSSYLVSYNDISNTARTLTQISRDQT